MLMSPRKTLMKSPTRRAAPAPRPALTGRTAGLVGDVRVAGGKAVGVSWRSGASCSSCGSRSWCAEVAIRPALYPGERQGQMSFRATVASAGWPGYRSLPMAARREFPGLHPGSSDQLDERERRVLAAIVRDYIHGGEPVGSHAIARRPDVDVSSATVRAVMADLEEMGFLEKPHTSAGRIPTARGYRYYVDALLRVRQPLPEEREQIERRAHEAAAGVDGLMTAASRVLHSLTKHAGVVSAPRPQSERLQRIEFLRLREGRVLAVVVAPSAAIRNRLI